MCSLGNAVHGLLLAKIEMNSVSTSPWPNLKFQVKTSILELGGSFRLSPAARNASLEPRPGRGRRERDKAAGLPRDLTMKRMKRPLW
jgi:hypothetical protein